MGVSNINLVIAGLKVHVGKSPITKYLKTFPCDKNISGEVFNLLFAAYLAT